MSIKVIIPPAGDSITTASVGKWHKADGEQVQKGETLVTIETDKVSNELEAEVDGVLKILVAEGDEVSIGTVVAEIEEGEGLAPAAPVADTAAPEITATEGGDSSPTGEVIEVRVPPAGDSITSASLAEWHVRDGAQVAVGDRLVTLETDKVSNELEAEEAGVLTILTAEGTDVKIGTVIGTIAVGAAASSAPSPSAPASPPVALPAAAPSSAPASAPALAPIKPDLSVVSAPSGREELTETNDGRTSRKKMSMLRRKIATQLVNAQQTAAILSTFNEVDMSAVMKVRKMVQEDFVAKYGVKLGFMSFFVKAVVQGLKEVENLNARIEGTDMVQNHFYDIGVAVGTEKGLVVPVIRDADKKSFAEIEQDILNYAMKARDGKIQLEDMQGGSFTISNGGVYGSLLSTPILNPPQSGILGMHTIQQRPIAVNGQVEIRPMMYLALSYDHRIVDGKAGVSFLIRVKEAIENPTRLMLEL